MAAARRVTSNALKTRERWHERQADEKLHASRNALTLQRIHGLPVGLSVGLTVVTMQTPGIAIDDLDVLVGPLGDATGYSPSGGAFMPRLAGWLPAVPSQEHAQERLDLST